MEFVNVVFAVDMTSNGKPCTIPFIYLGQSYASCTTRGAGSTYWCATTDNYDRDKESGICTCTSDGKYYQCISVFCSVCQYSNWRLSYSSKLYHQVTYESHRNILDYPDSTTLNKYAERSLSVVAPKIWKKSSVASRNKPSFDCVKKSLFCSKADNVIQ